MPLRPSPISSPAGRKGSLYDIVILKREAASLRQAITDYHGSVLGHGVLLTELEERLARVERHLDLRS